MQYQKIIQLRDGRACCLCSTGESDGQAVYDNFIQTHEETDYLLTYSDENSFTVSQEADFLRRKTDSTNTVEIIAVVDGVVAGTAGIDALGMRDKIKHRAVFGIAITKEFWGHGNLKTGTNTYYSITLFSSANIGRNCWFHNKYQMI